MSAPESNSKRNALPHFFPSSVPTASKLPCTATATPKNSWVQRSGLGRRLSALHEDVNPKTRNSVKIVIGALLVPDRERGNQHSAAAAIRQSKRVRQTFARQRGPSRRLSAH